MVAGLKLVGLVVTMVGIYARAEGPLLFEPVAGSCPKVIEEEKYVCEHITGEEGEIMKVEKFPPKPSKDVKTRTQTCDKNQLKKLLELQANAKDMQVDQLKLFSCTAIVEDEKSVAFLIESGFVRKEDDVSNGPWKLTTLAKKAGEDIEPITSYLSQDSYSSDEYYVESICDTDKDNKADLIIREKDYNGGGNLLIYKNLGIKGFSETSQSFKTLPGCGC